MAIERAVVKGNIAGIVETRHVFTADVVPSGGDTAHLLWQTYLASIYTAAPALLSAVFATYEVELLSYSAGHWVPYEKYGQVWGFSGAGDYLPNAVAIVLLGKAPGLRHVGRKFLSAIPENLTTANALVGAGITYAASVLLAYITPFTGIGGGVITPGVIDVVGNFHPFTGGIVSSLLGSMRRRKPGIGI